MAQAIAFQVAIAVTNTAQQLPSNPTGRGVTLLAKTGNTADIAVGNSSAVTTATGALLHSGIPVLFEDVNGNTNALWIVGTAGDVISVIGVGQ
jgi:hypothetical protein